MFVPHASAAGVREGGCIGKAEFGGKNVQCLALKAPCLDRRQDQHAQDYARRDAEHATTAREAASTPAQSPNPVGNAEGTWQTPSDEQGLPEVRFEVTPAWST